MAGSWSNTAVNSLTIPTGATTGARIVIDGSSDAILLYNSTNNLIISLAATAGTDSLGNSYPAGLNVSGGGLINVPAPTPGSVVFTSEVYGDAFARMNFLVDGTMTWGNGAAPADTNFYRSQTGQLQTDGALGVGTKLKVNTYIVREVSGQDAAWQTVANGGITLNAGWATDATSPGTQLLQYRIDAQDNLVIVGCCHTTSATPSATIFSVAGLYMPKALQRAAVDQSAGGVQSINRVNISSSTGAVTLATAVAAANVDVYFDVCVPLGNLP